VWYTNIALTHLLSLEKQNNVKTHNIIMANLNDISKRYISYREKYHRKASQQVHVYGFLVTWITLDYNLRY